MTGIAIRKQVTCNVNLPESFHLISKDLALSTDLIAWCIEVGDNNLFTMLGIFTCQSVPTPLDVLVYLVNALH